MKDYTFDVKLVVTAQVQADSLKEARNLIAGVSSLNLDVTEGPCRIRGGEVDDVNGPCCTQIDGEDYDDDLISDDIEVKVEEDDEAIDEEEDEGDNEDDTEDEVEDRP